MNDIPEIWKDIKDYKGRYQVSNLGRIKSLSRICKLRNTTRKVRGRILKPAKDKGGYLIVRLCKKGKPKTFTIHKLVLSTFSKKLSKNYEVNHKDGNKLNNNLDNLEWITHKENIHHAWRTGLIKKESKLSNKIEEIKRIYSQGNIFQKDLAKKYGVSQQTISDIMHNKIAKRNF